LGQNRLEARFLDPGWLILVSVRRGLIVCFLRLLFAGQFRLEVRCGRRLSEAERELNRRLARVKQRERNESTAVEFWGGTVLGIWYGVRRGLPETERASDRKLTRVNRRERNGLAAVEHLESLLVRRIWPRARCINWRGFCAENGEKLKILMCVLAPVRNFRFLCFEEVTGNSVCGAVPVRSGRPLVHFEVTTGSILAGFGRRVIVTSLPQTAATYPPLALPIQFAARPSPASAGKLAKRTPALAPLSGHKNIIRIFWVKLFVARFWCDFKEWEAVCVNYFCEKFRFGNEGKSRRECRQESRRCLI
jgi:hypothetical protein